MQLLEYNFWCAAFGISLDLSYEDLEFFADKVPPVCVDGTGVEVCDETSMRV